MTWEGKNKRWTREEDNRIKTIAPSIHKGEISYWKATNGLLTQLPGRTYEAIRTKLRARVIQIQLEQEKKDDAEKRATQ